MFQWTVKGTFNDCILFEIRINNFTWRVYGLWYKCLIFLNHKYFHGIIEGTLIISLNPWGHSAVTIWVYGPLWKCFTSQFLIFINPQVFLGYKLIQNFIPASIIDRPLAAPAANMGYLSGSRAHSGCRWNPRFIPNEALASYSLDWRIVGQAVLLSAYHTWHIGCWLWQEQNFIS